MLQRVDRLLLPVGLVAVVLLGLAAPALGQSVAGISAGPASFTDCCVIAIFLCNGLLIHRVVVRDPALLRAAVAVLGINLLLAPLLAAAVLRLVDLPLGLAVGIALMMSVPATLSSATVIASNAGGDRLWALALTLACVLPGSVTAPLAASAILRTELALDPWPILQQVVVIVLLPTLAGALLRRGVGRIPRWVALLPSVAVLCVVWVTVSGSAGSASDLGGGLLAAMALAAVLGHGALLAAGSLASRGMPREQAMPVLFVASQKTLPLALALLALIGQQSPQVAAVGGAATMCCLIWHFLQLFGDSALAARLSVRAAVRR